MKDKIIETASTWIEQYGLRKFTMDQIAHELGMSKKTVYKYFDSKDGIISEYFNAILESDKQNTLLEISKTEDWKLKLKALVLSYHKYRLPLPVIEEARRFYSTEWDKVEAYRKLKIRLINDLIHSAVKEGHISKEIHPEIVIFMIDKISSILYEHKFLRDNDLTLKQALEESYKIIVKGICEP